jgi:transposase
VFQPDALNAADTVRAYKSLANVERAFRSLKTVDLDILPVFHWVSPRVRAHVLVCSSDCSWFARVAGGRR